LLIKDHLMNTPVIVLAALSPLIAWRMYSRTRRLVGRQRLSVPRQRIAIGIYSTLILVLGYIAWPQFGAVASLAAGVALGAVLAVFGLRLTQFERTSQGRFYTPNAHIGIALSVLFACRILYRLVDLYILRPSSNGTAGNFFNSPATLIIFGTLAGYFVAYAIGVLRWCEAWKRDAKGGASSQDDCPIDQ
jgi:drug/metabolite transporter superfamily protein YnfA